jgi:hypothetical protein
MGSLREAKKKNYLLSFNGEGKRSEEAPVNRLGCC